MKLLATHWPKFEIAGALLVLLSIYWQVFFEDPYPTALDAQIFSMNEKLGMIFHDVYRDDSEPLTAEALTNFYRFDKDVKTFATQHAILTNIRGGLFLLGTLLLVAGRYGELQNRR